MNSNRYLPDVGAVIVLDEPSPPVTFPETLTDVGIVIVCAVLTKVMSSIILPTLFDAGRLVKDSVTLAFVVSV